MLDGLLGSPPATAGGGGGRAFGACCFAGKLPSPAPVTGEPFSPGPLLVGDPYGIPYVNP